MTAPVRVGFLVHTFSFGGSAAGATALAAVAAPPALAFAAVAAPHALPLADGRPAPGGGFPPIFMAASPHVDPADPRVRLVRDPAEAVRTVVERSDVVI